jgi:hypothetical protein
MSKPIGIRENQAIYLNESNSKQALIDNSKIKNAISDIDKNISLVKDHNIDLKVNIKDLTNDVRSIKNKNPLSLELADFMIIIIFVFILFVIQAMLISLIPNKTVEKLKSEIDIIITEEIEAKNSQIDKKVQDNNKLLETKLDIQYKLLIENYNIQSNILKNNFYEENRKLEDKIINQIKLIDNNNLK